MRHRSSAATVDRSSAHFDAVQARSDTRAAPTPLPRPHAACYVICCEKLILGWTPYKDVHVAAVVTTLGARWFVTYLGRS